MKSKFLKKYQYSARVFRALACPSRLFIVDELSKQDLCVCDLARKLGVDKSTVSKHLSILRDAELVDSEKQGTMVFYGLKSKKVLKFLDCAKKLLTSQAQEKLNLLKTVCSKIRKS